MKKREEDLKFLTTEEHRQAWIDFCATGLPVGEPDPHQGIVEFLSRSEDQEERAWRSGCYIGLYVVASAGLVWSEWSYKKVLADPQGFSDWVKQQFTDHRLILRRERRAVKSAPKLAASLLSIHEWIEFELPLMALTQNYDEVWESVTKKIKFFGRYASIKFIESLRRNGCIIAQQQDIRPAGAWSPRLVLSAFYPEVRDLLVDGDDKPETCRIVNTFARAAKIAAEASGCRQMTWFELEVLLCNYRQMIHRKYPGSTHDTELGYYVRLYNIWGRELLERVPMLLARKTLFDWRCLGELNGWFGGREVLENVFYLHRYHWSDLKYCFYFTRDFSNPVKWEDLSDKQRKERTEDQVFSDTYSYEVFDAGATDKARTAGKSSSPATFVEERFQFD